MKNLEVLSFPGTELPNERVARGVRPVERAKPVNCLKKPKLTQNAQIFFEICAGAELFSAMLLQRSLSQYVEGVGPFPSFLCFSQPSLEHFHPCLAHVHSCPIMIFHVSKQVLILVGLGQQPLQMSIEPEKHSLSLKNLLFQLFEMLFQGDK